MEVDAGYQYSLAVDVAGNAWAWGFPVPYGTGNKLVPELVAGATDIVEVSAGFDHVVARTGSGAVLAWGANYRGQLGQGDTTVRAGVVTVPGLTDVTDLAAGERFTLAAHGDGSATLWGENFGRYLAGGADSLTSPVDLPGLASVAAVGRGLDPRHRGHRCRHDLHLGVRPLRPRTRRLAAVLRPGADPDRWPAIRGGG